MREIIQEKAKSVFLGSKRGILQIAQRVGKIKISLMVINELFADRKNTPKILVAYPDNRIQDSWVSDIEKWGYPTNVEFIFCNYSSVWKHTDNQYDMVVLDEVHATSPNQRQLMIPLVRKVPIVLGLSGTISKETEQELQDTLNLNVLMKYTVEEAIEDGIISPYQITIHMVRLDTIIKTPNKKGKMVSEKDKYDSYTWVFNKLKEEGKDYKHILLHRNRVLQSSHSKRLKTIQLLKSNKGKKIIVFTGLKKISEGLGIPFYHSTSEDTEVFNLFKEDKIREMAVVNIGRAGTTFPNLDVIIINSFTGNEETTEQIVARALNKDTNEKVAYIHIVCSTEEAEIKKLKKTLSSFNDDNILWT